MSAVAEPLTNAPEAELETAALAVRKQLEAVVITDHASYLDAAERLKAAAAARRKIEEFFKPMKTSARATWQAVVDREKEMLSAVSDAEEKGRTAITRYEAEQRRILEEQRQKAAEAQRVEQARLQALADEENRLAQIEAQRLADEERLALASQIEEQGATPAEIDQVLSAPVVVQAPVQVAPMVAVAPPIPQFQRAPGLTAARENWKAEVTNILELAAYVVANPQFANLIQGNEIALNAMAKANKKLMNIPGVRAYDASTSVGVRSSK